MSDDKDKPLISKHSPSLARAQKEHANPAPTADPELVAALARVLELEQASAWCHEKVRGSDDATARHAGKARRLGALIDSLGASAPQGDEVRTDLLPVAPKDFEYLSDAQAVAAAVKRNEAALDEGYAALGRLTLPDDVREAIDALRSST